MKNAQICSIWAFGFFYILILLFHKKFRSPLILEPFY